MAVGATGGGGGGGGVACAAFLLQPENDNTPASTATSVNTLNVSTSLDSSLVRNRVKSEMAERLAQRSQPIGETPAQSDAPFAAATQSSKFGNKLEGNQQRRMTSQPGGKLAVANSTMETAVEDKRTSARRAKLRQLRTTLSPARTIAMRKPAAARIDRSAVTGPCTTEYGPCIAGKKKIVSTQRTAITASVHPIRPEVMEP